MLVASSQHDCAEMRSFMKKEIHIRHMTKADAAQAAAIESVCFPDPWSQESFEASLLLPYATYYVAEMAVDAEMDINAEETCNGTALWHHRIVGICGIRKIMGEGEITNVAVLPSHRRCGIAESMLTCLLEESRAEGVDDFTLEVRSGNAPAIRLYESLGFAAEGTRPRFYRNPQEDALIMWLRSEK